MHKNAAHRRACEPMPAPWAPRPLRPRRQPAAATPQNAGLHRASLGGRVWRILKAGPQGRARLPSAGAGPVCSKLVSTKLPTRRSGTFHLHLQASAEMCRRDRGSQQSHPRPALAACLALHGDVAVTFRGEGPAVSVCDHAAGAAARTACGTGSATAGCGTGGVCWSPWVSSVTALANPQRGLFQALISCSFSPQTSGQ